MARAREAKPLAAWATAPHSLSSVQGETVAVELLNSPEGSSPPVPPEVPAVEEDPAAASAVEPPLVSPAELPSTGPPAVEEAASPPASPVELDGSITGTGATLKETGAGMAA